MTTETEIEKEDRGDDFIPEPEEIAETPAEEPAAATEEPVTEPITAKADEREPMIPHARFEELNQRLKLEQASRLELESRLNELARKTEAPKPPPFDAGAAEKDYLKAVLEGDIDRASVLMGAIRAHERQQIEAEVTVRTRAEIEQARALTALETVAEAAVQQYPFLDPTSPSANPAAIAEVVEWRDYYVVAKGMKPAAALKSAVARVAPAHNKTPPAAQTAPNERTLAQRQANAKISAQQPPTLSGVGVGDRAQRQARTDPEKLTDAEFAALPAAEKARLRGDIAA